MALNLSKQYTFTPNTTIASAQVNTDLDDLYNALSGLEALTKTLAKLKVDGDPATALEVATKQYVDAYATYTVPTLVFIDVNNVDVENNTTTANQTKIIFPDGNYRSVTEDTSSANKYRRFTMSATAEFTSGTEDSGMRSGESEPTNGWVQIYAVKSLINSANFVLVGTQLTPIAANAATLNTRFGTNSWVYLGSVRNGDGGTATTDIVNFTQCGNYFCFNNLATSTNASSSLCGFLLTTTASATSLTYSYSAGNGTTQIPKIFTNASYSVCKGTVATRLSVLNSATTIAFIQIPTPGAAERIGVISPLNSISNGVSLSTGSATALDILLFAWTDGCVGTCATPVP